MAPRRGVFGRVRRWLNRITAEPPAPPPEPPPPAPPSGPDYGELERRVLRHIDSLHLENLPDRIDKNGVRHEAEYNRNRVAQTLRDKTELELNYILEMDRDEFRSWAKATGFFYH